VELVRGADGAVVQRWPAQVGAAGNGEVRVGEVGETGRASGCHLHFELWTQPGWYEGGKAIDPLPELQRWDALS
jgi:murein DD-endopeptidase MepM/ murein hydrolase activator NlpD